MNFSFLQNSLTSFDIEESTFDHRQATFNIHASRKDGVRILLNLRKLETPFEWEFTFDLQDGNRCRNHRVAISFQKNGDGKQKFYDMLIFLSFNMNKDSTEWVTELDKSITPDVYLDFFKNELERICEARPIIPRTCISIRDNPKDNEIYVKGPMYHWYAAYFHCDVGYEFSWDEGMFLFLGWLECSPMHTPDSLEKWMNTKGATIADTNDKPRPPAQTADDSREIAIQAIVKDIYSRIRTEAMRGNFQCVVKLPNSKIYPRINNILKEAGYSVLYSKTENERWLMIGWK